MGCHGLREARNRGSLPDEMLDPCVRNEEVVAEQGFEVRVESLETDGLGEPRLAPPETVRLRYPRAALAFVFSPRRNVDKPFTGYSIP